MAPPEDARSEVDHLRREVRRLKTAGALLALALLLTMALGGRWLAARRELTVERVNVVDPDGTVRLVLADTERFPAPIVGGKELPRAARAVRPAGMVFYDAKGSELGGLAITDTKDVRASALAFDYPNYDAIGLVTRVSPDGKSGMAGLQINSRPPAELDVRAAAKLVQRRIAIQNEDEDATISLADPAGNDRIRLRVDRRGEASIEMLDAAGHVTVRVPEKPAN